MYGQHDMITSRTKVQRVKPLAAQIETKKRAYPGIDLEWKVLDADQGIIRGYLSVFNNVDFYKDRVRPGAYKKTISEGLQRKDNKGKKFLWPLLWMHDAEKPIGGFIDAVEDKKGLLVTAKLDISTTPEGYPRNPLAMSVFSGFQEGYIDELSVGYKALQKSYDQQGVRDLLEMQVFEGSACTMLQAANDLAQVTDVKSASGGSFALADRNTPWSKSKAIKDIEAATGGDWSKASKYFFWSAPDPKTEADHKMPFAAKVGGEFKAVPAAIIASAGAIRGARGGVNIPASDLAGVKSKIAGYYHKMGMTPPWSASDGGDGDKFYMQTLEKKDFSDYYQARQVNAWMDKFYDLTCALKAAVIDCFADGDQDSDVSTDIEEVLNGDGDNPGFIHALMDWAQEGQELGYTGPSGSGSYGYMAANNTLENKAGAVVSKENADRLTGHINTMRQVKDMVHSVAEDMQRYITGSPPYAPGVNIPTSGGKSAIYQDGPQNAPDEETISRASTNDDEFLAEMTRFLNN